MTTKIIRLRPATTTITLADEAAALQALLAEPTPPPTQIDDRPDAVVLHFRSLR